MEAMAYYVAFSQYAAITAPFADHFATINLFDKYDAGTLAVQDFFRFHNEHKPAVPRLIFFTLGIMSDWDVWLEVVALNVVFISIPLLIVYKYFRIHTLRTGLFYFLCALAVALIMSPASHTNWWWSYMLELVLAVAFSAASFVLADSTKLTNHLAAIILASLGVLSQAAGLFIAPAIIASLIINFIFIGAKKTLPLVGLWTVTWCIQLALYLPGVDTAGRARPDIDTIIAYVITFIGKPVAQLISFQHLGMWGYSSNIAWPFTCGIIALLLAVIVGVKHLKARRDVKPRGLVFEIACISFAIAVGASVGWGRAAAEGVKHANTAPTALIAAMFYVGLGALILSNGEIMRTFQLKGKNGIIILIILAGLMGVTQHRAAAIARQAHDFNENVTQAYLSGDPDHPTIQSLYPNKERALRELETLRRLKLTVYSK